MFANVCFGDSKIYTPGDRLEFLVHLVIGYNGDSLSLGGDSL